MRAQRFEGVLQSGHKGAAIVHAGKKTRATTKGSHG